MKLQKGSRNSRVMPTWYGRPQSKHTVQLHPAPDVQ